MARRIPAYQLHKATGQAKVRLSRHEFDLRPHGSPASKAEHDPVLAEWITNGRQLVLARAAPEKSGQASEASG
jgi:hypothetical protein